MISLLTAEEHLLSANEAVTDCYLKISDTLKIEITIRATSPSVSVREEKQRMQSFQLRPVSVSPLTTNTFHSIHVQLL